MPTIVVVNKMDLKPEQSFSEVERTCEELGVPCFQISAKDNLESKNVFFRLIDMMNGKTPDMLPKIRDRTFPLMKRTFEKLGDCTFNFGIVPPKCRKIL